MRNVKRATRFAMSRHVLLGTMVFTTACTSAGATWRSGVGDAFLERAPYYAGRTTSEVKGTAPRLGHLPVLYQRGAAQPSLFDPTASASMQALLSDMTAYIDSLGISVRLAEGGRVSAVASSDTDSPPDVQFGCVVPSGIPDDACLPSGQALGRGRQQVRLAVGRPSAAWTGWARSLATASNVDATLVITLEVGRYPIRQQGLRGKKSVELGTNHIVALPWLTSLEQPVWVVQLTGAIVDRDGKALRIGAEGLLARRTPLLASAVGAERIIADDDVAALRTAVRDDVAGNPLVWREGLRNLLAGLGAVRE